MKSIHQLNVLALVKTGKVFATERPQPAAMSLCPGRATRGPRDTSRASADGQLENELPYVAL
eukprot:6989091-Prymnesium_polylepis.1